MLDDIMALLKFYKMHGAGNDFVLIDNRTAQLMPDSTELFKQICDFHRGVGADGIMLLDQTEEADFQVYYINADGTPGEMCGNGARCAVALAQELGLAEISCRFLMWDKLYIAGRAKNGEISILMGDYKILAVEKDLMPLFPASVAGALWLDTGVPHLVLEWRENLDGLDVDSLGRFYCHHERFLPSRTNVNFIAFDDQNECVDIRTYERGVERETLACGTGAVAAALYLRSRQPTRRQVTACYAGGHLLVDFADGSGEIYLSGPVKRVFEGQIDIDTL